MHDLIIQNGEVIFPSTATIDRANIFIGNGKIKDITRNSDGFNPAPASDTEIIDAEGRYVAPGFIDLQVNGGGGADFLEASDKQLAAFGDLWASTGCTSFLATVITEKIDRMRSAIDKLTNAEWDNFCGIHIEGPFISIEKKGTHDPSYIQDPSTFTFNKLIEGYADRVKLFTLAPELSGSNEVIKKLEELGITASIGHSAATFTEAEAGLDAGIDSFTHLYNGMTGLHHRRPGCVGCALTSDAYTGLISDGLHVHPAAIQIVGEIKRPEKIYLVTDAISAAGLSEGIYNLGGQKIVVEGGIAHLENGTISGSTLTMDKAVKNYMKFAGVDIARAVQSATFTPAKLIGIEDRKGSIEIDKDADLVIFNEELEIDKTIIGGDVSYDNGG